MIVSDTTQPTVEQRYAAAVQREIGELRTKILALRVQCEASGEDLSRLVALLTLRDELVAGLQERVGRAEAAGREVAEQLRVARQRAHGVVGETLLGLVDGVNRVFHTGCPVRKGTMVLCTPHVTLMEGDGGDFTVAGDVVTFKAPPASGTRLTANYGRARRS